MAPSVAVLPGWNLNAPYAHVFPWSKAAFFSFSSVPVASIFINPGELELSRLVLPCSSNLYLAL